jgi:trans-aconitate 2-methyltransferase
MEPAVAQQIWHAEGYHSHSAAQSTAASQLLQYFRFKGNEQVLDVGCGDGKISATIASYVPAGSVLGVDISPEMIGFAHNLFPKERFPNLLFLIQDAQHLDYNGKFDVIFSSFALQWILDHDSFLQAAYKSLRPFGCLVATIPLDISKLFEESIAITISLPEWAPYFHNFSKNWHFPTDIEFARMLSMHQFMPTLFEVVSQEVIFPSKEAFENYVLQWFPYFRPLPEDLKQVFLKQVMDKYFEFEPIQSGKVRFIFSRLDIIAHKVIP